MTAFMKWITETAEQIAKDDVEVERSIQTTTVQRVAIGLCQARAAELRHLAGELVITGAAAASKHIAILAVQYRDRSHKLEQLGLRIAAEWPLKDEDQIPEKAKVTLQ